MKRQRGFGLIVYLVLALAVVGALGAIYHGIDSRAEERGELKVQARWDAQNAKDAERARQRRDDQLATARRHSEQLHLAQAEAAANEQLWREAREEGRRNGTALAVCTKGKGAANAGGSNAGPRADDGGGLDLRLTWQFVGLWDSAWTGPDGKPVHGDPGGVLARAQSADPAAPSPYGPDDVLDNHKANADACSADRRLLARLTALIKDLRDRWDAIK